MVEYLDRVEAGMKAAAARMKVSKTGEGVASIDSSTRGNGAGVTGELSFKEYLRFVDMGVGRGHPLGGLKATKVALQASNRVGTALKKDNTYKPKKLYSKTAYGNLNYLYNKLLYGYTEETIAMLKKEIAEKNTNANV